MFWMGATPCSLALVSGRFAGRHGSYTVRWNSRRSSHSPYQSPYISWFQHMNPYRQEIYPDTTKTGVWFRNTVALMFYTSRIPQPGCDVFSPKPSPMSANARKVVVTIGDILYAIEVYDVEGIPLSPERIERRLHSAVQDYHARMSAGKKAPTVGIMTSDERDTWATVRAPSLFVAFALTHYPRTTHTCGVYQATTNAYST